MNLQLSLKTKWFEMTKAGIKTEDYREITPYWVKRLTCCDTDINSATEDLKKGEKNINRNSHWLPNFYFPKKFIQNTMTLGYPKSGDTERVLKLEHKGIEIRTGNPEWGAEPGKLYFVILHGKQII
jgi:hypothetical protein